MEALDDGWLYDVALIGFIGHAALTELVGAKSKNFIFGGQEKGELDPTGNLDYVLTPKMLRAKAFGGIKVLVIRPMPCLEIRTGAPGVRDAVRVQGKGVASPADHICDSLVFEKEDFLRRVEELFSAADAQLAEPVAAPGENLGLGREDDNVPCSTRHRGNFDRLG